MAHHVNWGDVPTWLAVVGVAVAVREYARAKKDRRTEQASRVSEVSSFEYTRGREEEHGEATVVVLNRNDIAIRDCQVDLLSWDHRQKLAGRHIPSIRPGEDSGPVQFTLDPPPLTSPERFSSLNPPIRLEFTDGRGRRWRRMPDAKLREIGRVTRWWQRVRHAGANWGCR